MTPAELFGALLDVTPGGETDTLGRLAGPNAPMLREALTLIRNSSYESCSPDTLIVLLFIFGVYCAERGLASTIPEVQERMRSR